MTPLLVVWTASSLWTLVYSAVEQFTDITAETFCNNSGAFDACILNCTNTNCRDESFHCGAGIPCIVDCDDQNSCRNMDIYGENATQLTVITALAQEILHDTRIYAPLGDLYVKAQGKNAFQDGFIYSHPAGSNHISLDCSATDGSSNNECKSVQIHAETANSVDVVCRSGDGVRSAVCTLMTINATGASRLNVTCQDSAICGGTEGLGFRVYAPKFEGDFSESRMQCLDTASCGFRVWTELGVPRDVDIHCDTNADCNRDSFGIVYCTDPGDSCVMTEDSGTWSCVGDCYVPPTENPTTNPTLDPTSNPSTSPTAHPTGSPSANPTTKPSVDPTANPTGTPTTNPSENPSTNPTANPSEDPSMSPTTNPSATPSSHPSASPSTNPTSNPTETGDTAGPTASPTDSGSPTLMPSSEPSTPPTMPGDTPDPTQTPGPTGQPSAPPSGDPTSDPTAAPPGVSDTTTEEPEPPSDTTEEPGGKSGGGSDILGLDSTTFIIILVVLIVVLIAGIIGIILWKRHQDKQSDATAVTIDFSSPKETPAEGGATTTQTSSNTTSSPPTKEIQLEVVGGAPRTSPAGTNDGHEWDEKAQELPEHITPGGPNDLNLDESDDEKDIAIDDADVDLAFSDDAAAPAADDDDAVIPATFVTPQGGPAVEDMDLDEDGDGESEGQNEEDDQKEDVLPANFETPQGPALDQMDLDESDDN